MSIVKIKIINESPNPLPEYITEGSAGMDIRAHLAVEVVLKPMQRLLIPTGIFIELPPGFEAQVRPRSGLAINHGITCLNSPGTIDSDYRGEIRIILINLSNEEHVIKTGDRIAQLIISKVERAEWEPAFSINETIRNKGGFGHTGKS